MIAESVMAVDTDERHAVLQETCEENSMRRLGGLYKVRPLSTIRFWPVMDLVVASTRT